MRMVAIVYYIFVYYKRVHCNRVDNNFCYSACAIKERSYKVGLGFGYYHHRVRKKNLHNRKKALKVGLGFGYTITPPPRIAPGLRRFLGGA